MKIFSGLVFYIYLASRLHLILAYLVDNSYNKASAKPQVALRAVFINCEQDDIGLSSDNESTRFEREELFKHNELKQCSKKLALTVKITSEADTDNSGDEYLPIEHVFEGVSKKTRVRLLDPYILRLRRDVPLQAYKLRRIDTVSGVLSNNVGSIIDEKRHQGSRNRAQRDVALSAENHANIDLWGTQRNTITVPESQVPSTLLTTTDIASSEFKEFEKKTVCINPNDTINKRYKRNEHNIIIETATEDNNWISEGPKDRIRSLSVHDGNKYTSGFDDKLQMHDLVTSNHKSAKSPEKESVLINHRTMSKSNQRKLQRVGDSRTYKSQVNEDEVEDPDATPSQLLLQDPEHYNMENKKTVDKPRKNFLDSHINYATEKDYAVYEIGSPELWYSVHLQLFEKLSTPGGKTVWNDLTKGDLASVSSLSPEWIGPDMNIRYRSSKWMPREEFTLPDIKLCLMVPTNEERDIATDDNMGDNGTFDVANFMVVPKSDVIGLTDEDMKKRHNNSQSDTSSTANVSDVVQEKHRKVIVRTARAIVKNKGNWLTIASKGDEKYLTLHHRRPYLAQIDLEVRADENDLVRVGSSGRISIAVSDSTRKRRNIINLQVGNTGLAAARFRIVANDFDPFLADLVKREDASAGPILIPPRHTRAVSFELPIEIPVDVAHFSVSLINDDEQSVAVRDVTVKKGDRCFCVWHCDCVCLGDDPKLLCRSMDETRQKAAGLSTRDKARYARGLSYPDVITINLCVLILGVLGVLLLLGLVKAFMGLMCACIGTWGMQLILHTPRKLDHYFEPALRGRSVIYDPDGWPVHPDTRARNVRFISKTMEFMLNIIIFIVVPGIIICDGCKQLLGRVPTTNKMTSSNSDSRVPNVMSSKKYHNPQDMQRVTARFRRHRDGAHRRWMTPQAQEISTELWQKSLRVYSALKGDSMQPLLCKTHARDEGSNVTHDSCLDSEQDDTEYVLTQMQKSRESLARSQKKINETDPSVSPNK